ncbi:methyltransferase, putative [Oceaniovalibus guishaninsula JLT2003]|uniref:Methyltransferase, putative n=1 Tax=Oceaniovalibus guishaninsula JLT2003 TaxID=1231392 RepID=K2HN01_9RHOB|nr:16S rRNA (guanine(966)-N(2))-methyltransferase RsmD [Oceaniovalibus guishaninsula]EKE44214.1 methyltransferase, putative [Oceaniovalibus guishaninsula JLT2003]
MRIVGGTFRGRTLTPLGKGDPAAQLRPTTDRVRETLFNLLGNHGAPAEGQRVLDLFAGTGALGFEALSRGAERVTFVENGRRALDILRANAVRLDVGDRATILRRDATRLGRGDAHDLILLDPPYGRGLGERALHAAMDGGWIAQDALIAWEEAVPPRLPEGLRQIDQRRYGDTVLTLARTG